MKLDTITIPYNNNTITLWVNDVTEYSEPRIWIHLSDNTLLEIVLKKVGIPNEKHYYSIRRHCSEADLENGKYEKTSGVIEVLDATTEDDLIQTLSELFVVYVEKGVRIVPASR